MKKTVTIYLLHRLFVFLMIVFVHIICTSAKAQVSPRKMNVDKRYSPVYVDSIIGEHQNYLSKLEAHPKSITRDTLRLKTMVYLSYLYLYTTTKQRRDSSLLWSQRVVKKAKEIGNGFYLIEGMTKEAEYTDRFSADYQRAVQILNKTLDIPKITETQRFFAKRMIGSIYAKTDSPNATAYTEKLINEIRQSSISEHTKAQNLYNLYIAIAETNQRKNNYGVSLKAYLMAAEEVKKFNKGIGLAYLYASIAESYVELGQYQKATTYTEEAQYLFDKLKIPYGETINFTYAKIYLKNLEYEKAASKGEMILQNITQRKFKKYSTITQNVHKLLYDSYKGLGDNEKALPHLETYMSVKDSLEYAKKVKEIGELITKYDFERVQIEGQKLLLEKNNQIKDLQLKEYKSMSESQDFKSFLLQEKLDKEQAINTSRAKTLENLKQKQIYNNNLEQLKIGQLNEQLKLQKQAKSLWYSLTVLSLLLFVVGVLVFVNQYRQKLQFKQQGAEYNQKIAQTEITALRAQMNPHFIFNCLNSIQLFTAQNNIDKASNYLSKFSRLIRLVLENSRSEKVTLENELESLRLYIELEAMRFRDKFSYTISVAPSIDQGYVQIPPLLLQPFVENAIWHGLMHKEEGGKVIIIVEPQYITAIGAGLQDITAIQVTITDDGVGREKSAEFKSKSVTKNKSFGMKVTAERIELINQLYKTETIVQIIDLKDANGQASGTTIVIEIPV